MFPEGDTDGFNDPKFLAGCRFYKGKVEEVNWCKERRLKVFCKYHPKAPIHKLPLSLTMRNENVYLIKGSDSADQEQGDLKFDK